MPVALFMDHHAARAITFQLRLRGVDVLTAYEDGSHQLPDEQVLERCHVLDRLLFTQDHRFRAMAEDWQRQGRDFSGLVFGLSRGRIGQFVNDLELIAKASDPADWRNTIDILPY